MLLTSSMPRTCKVTITIVISSWTNNVRAKYHPTGYIPVTLKLLRVYVSKDSKLIYVQNFPSTVLRVLSNSGTALYIEEANACEFRKNLVRFLSGSRSNGEENSHIKRASRIFRCLGCEVSSIVSRITCCERAIVLGAVHRLPLSLRYIEIGWVSSFHRFAVSTSSSLPYFLTEKWCKKHGKVHLS